MFALLTFTILHEYILVSNMSETHYSSGFKLLDYHYGEESCSHMVKRAVERIRNTKDIRMLVCLLHVQASRDYVISLGTVL